jgi:hypothetical protein
MRKKRWLLIFLIFVMVIGPMACSSGKSDTPAPTPTPTPTPTPSIKTDGFAAIPDSQYSESITVVMNENFASGHSNWETKAQTMLDEMNAALNRTVGNKKQYTVGKFMTLLDANVESMYASGPDSSYYIDNGYARCGGTTVFFYLYDGAANMPSFFAGYPNGFRWGRIASDGRILEEVWIPYDTSIGSPFTNFVQGTLDYEIAVNPLFHELGHSLGLAAEEWYRYQFQDFTGVLPNLGAYSRPNQFPADPMAAGAVAQPEFAPFNSWLINKNANHQYRLEEIIEGVPDVIKVKVVDSANSPISGATVQVFAALWGSVPVTDPVLLINTTTDTNGEAVINSDDAATSTYGGVTYAHKFGVSVSAKIVKVASGGKVAGAFLTLSDLEVAFLQNGLNTLVIELTPE